MPKLRTKKVVKKTPIGFRADAMKLINERRKRTGQTETDALHDLIAGKDRFGPTAEQGIQEEMRRSGKARDDVIESMILAAMRERR